MNRPLITRSPSYAALCAAGAAFALMASPALAQNDDASEEPVEMTKGEKRLAKLLEGRVAGEPQNCIRSFPTARFKTIDKTAYVYGSGNTIYVQRTTRPDRIDNNDTLVTRRFGGGSQICRQEIRSTIDPVSGIFTGAVIFEDFVPYTRVKSDEEEG